MRLQGNCNRRITRTQYLRRRSRYKRKRNAYTRRPNRHLQPNRIHTINTSRSKHLQTLLAYRTRNYRIYITQQSSISIKSRSSTGAFNSNLTRTTVNIMRRRKSNKDYHHYRSPEVPRKMCSHSSKTKSTNRNRISHDPQFPRSRRRSAN